MNVVKKMSIILLLFVFIFSTAYAEIDVSTLSAEKYTVETDAFDGWTRIYPRYYSIHFNVYNMYTAMALKQTGLPLFACSSYIHIDEKGVSNFVYAMSVVSTTRSLNAQKMKIFLNNNAYEFDLVSMGDPVSMGSGIYIDQYAIIVDSSVEKDFICFVDDYTTAENPHCKIRFYGSNDNVDYDDSVNRSKEFSEGMEDTKDLLDLYISSK